MPTKNGERWEFFLRDYDIYLKSMYHNTGLFYWEGAGEGFHLDDPSMLQHKKKVLLHVHTKKYKKQHHLSFPESNDKVDDDQFPGPFSFTLPVDLSQNIHGVLPNNDDVRGTFFFIMIGEDVNKLTPEILQLMFEYILKKVLERIGDIEIRNIEEETNLDNSMITRLSTIECVIKIHMNVVQQFETHVQNLIDDGHSVSEPLR
jgi:hypothetical protein